MSGPQFLSNYAYKLDVCTMKILITVNDKNEAFSVLGIPFVPHFYIVENSITVIY